MNFRNFQFEQDPFSKNAEGIGKIYHGVLLLMKVLDNKLQIKIMKINFYDLYYTVIKSRDGKEIVNGQYEDNENEEINFNDFITPSHNIEINLVKQY